MEPKEKRKVGHPNSLKRKVKSIVSQEKSESSSVKIDRMIRWMQEMGIVLQEFTRQNNMRIFSFSPDMSGPTHPEHEEEEQESDEQKQNEEGEGNEETASEEEEED
ncbi:hypothetical protein V6Z11_D12G098400 [Gossypium hirsutum]|uniref:Histone chaperone cia1-like n=1 Tax=Gossypium hirsutum TaxID=3635 RepID=A0A1U8MTT5_GOSHI|nr:histone chaperone cia1-like [Gossypium hirsutum]